MRSQYRWGILLRRLRQSKPLSNGSGNKSCPFVSLQICEVASIYVAAEISPIGPSFAGYEVGSRRTLGSRLGLGFSAFSMGSSGLV
jgi:hypothetical protein